MKKNAKIKIQHSLYRPNVVHHQIRLRRIKNIVLIALYLSIVVIAIKSFDKDFINNVYALSLLHSEDATGDSAIPNDSSSSLKNTRKQKLMEKELKLKNLNEEQLQLKFFSKITGKQNIADYVIKYSKINNIEPSLIIALMKTESDFNPRAVNFNTNGSIDRGICQLNNTTFPMLKAHEFFNPEINIQYACQFLNWCLSTSNNNLVKALAYYQAGIGTVNNHDVGERTLDYINKIIAEKSVLDKDFINFRDEQLGL